MLDYTVIQPNRALRSQARKLLWGMWLQLILAVAIFCFSSWPSLIYDLGAQFTLWEDLSSWEDSSTLWNDRQYLKALISTFGFGSGLPWPWDIVDNLFSAIDLIIGGALFLGLAGYCMKITRGQEISIKNIFDGFKRFFSSFLLMFFSGLFTILWCLLLIIPGIIKGLGYSMAFFIMYDNPEIKPLEAIKKSLAMTKGYKWKLFKLSLIIVGQFILGLLLFFVVEGILPELIYVVVFEGFCWLFIAYFWLSLANFYENLKKNQEKTLAKDTGAETADISNDRPAVQDSGQEV
jgi:uncharacterized membrane protein